MLAFATTRLQKLQAAECCKCLSANGFVGFPDGQNAGKVSNLGDLAVARTAFESFLKDMRTDFAAKGAARTVELAEASTQALQALRALLQGSSPAAYPSPRPS